MTITETTTTTDLVWEDPPPKTYRGRPGLPWAEWADMLRANPGRWARLRTYKSSSVNPSARKFLPRDEFDMRGARLPDGSFGLFARYRDGSLNDELAEHLSTQ